MLQFFQIINPILSTAGSGDGGVILGNIIASLVGFSLVVGTLAALMFLLLGGIRWITAGGDKQKLQSAQESITHAIVGLIIVASSWAIFVLVANFVGIGDIVGKGVNIPSVNSEPAPNFGGNKSPTCLAIGAEPKPGETCCSGITRQINVQGKIITVCYPNGPVL